MPVRLVSLIFVLALLSGCAVPPTPISPAAPGSLPAFTPAPLDAPRSTPAAATALNPAACNAEEYVMRADGTDIRRVTTHAAWDGQPAWLPQPIEMANSAECPVTAPNGSQPPGEEVISPQYHGTGALWTVLPPDGILYVSRERDGRLSTKQPWWRGVSGTLTIEGRRLDRSGKFSAYVPDGYGDSGFQASGVYFSDEGCWEVRGRAGTAELKFVVDVKAGE